MTISALPSTSRSILLTVGANLPSNGSPPICPAMPKLILYFPGEIAGTSNVPVVGSILANTASAPGNDPTGLNVICTLPLPGPPAPGGAPGGALVPLGAAGVSSAFIFHGWPLFTILPWADTVGAVGGVGVQPVNNASGARRSVERKSRRMKTPIRDDGRSVCSINGRARHQPSRSIGSPGGSPSLQALPTSRRGGSTDRPARWDCRPNPGW